MKAGEAGILNGRVQWTPTIRLKMVFLMNG